MPYFDPMTATPSASTTKSTKERARTVMRVALIAGAILVWLAVLAYGGRTSWARPSAPTATTVASGGTG